MPFLKTYGFTLLVGFAALLRLLDSYKSPDTIYNITGYSSGFILAWIFAIIVVLRVFGKTVFPQKVVVLLLLSGAFLISGSFVLAYINFLIHENFIFGLTQIRMGKLFNLGLFLFFSGGVSLSFPFLKTHYKKLIFLTGILLIVLYYLYGFFPLDSRHQIAKEDSLVENFQFLFLVLSGIFSAKVSYVFLKKEKILSVLFLCAAFGFFFVAGDEISWGQRILNLEPPEYFVQTNAQREITVHNHVALHGQTPHMFTVVAGYCAFMWLLIKPFKKHVKKHSKLLFLVPAGFFFPYFIASFFYNFYTELGDHTIGDWSEPTELMLYLGVFLYIFILYKIQLKH